MKRLLTLGILGSFLVFSLAVLASVPNLINYQGRLTDDAGRPITTATMLRFSLYQGGDATTPGSGSLVYEEDAKVTPDRNGVFDHTIGTGTVIYGTLDFKVFLTNYPVYLEITVDPKGVADTLLPRKQVVSVGYSFISELAYNADKVDGKHASAFSLVGHHHDADYVNEGQADSVNSAMIVNGTIMNADINTSANIAATKINTTGLDADLLDGIDSTGFVSTAGDNMTGTLSVTVADTYALYGWNTTATGIKYGVYGLSVSSSGYGVYGAASALSGTNYGVYGRSDSPSGYAVYGLANAASGTNYGVTGISSSTYGRGVYGYCTATSGVNVGVEGVSNSISGYGVYGRASDTSGTNYGVYGESRSTSGYGVYGRAPYLGVFGYATATSGTTYGVYGVSEYGYGVFGACVSSGGYGVYGIGGAYAGYFHGPVHVTGNLTVAGSKPCVQPIDDGKKVLLYAMESPEIWFEDFGTAQLVNGRAVVPIERVFAQTANTEIGYFVFLIPNGDCNGLYISRKDKDSFEVRELGNGTSNITFDYRIVAKRRGYEEVRFEEFTEPEQPPAEPNLPVEKK